MSGNSEKAGKNNSNAVTRRNNIHAELFTGHRKFSAHFIVSVNVSETALKSFDENHRKYNWYFWDEQENRFG